MDDSRTAASRGAGRLVLAILSLPFALVIALLSLTVQLGYRDAASALATVVFLLLIALTLPVIMIVSGVRELRNPGSTSPGMLWGSLLFAGAAVLGVLVTAGPLVIDLTDEIARTVQAIAP